jgi:HAE1 family hydrophobic/amphiphilic exporter-1
MLSDYTNQRRAAGETLIQARSFASILMTTIAMVFGMFPIALASGAGWKKRFGLELWV